MKLASSPTPPVPEPSISKFSKFLTSWTNTPAIGPKAKEPIKAGTSEISNFKKVGVNHRGKI